jgi:hypothetical protein
MEGILRIVFGLSEAAEEEQDSPPSHTRFPTSQFQERTHLGRFSTVSRRGSSLKRVLQVPPSPQFSEEDFQGRFCIS